MSTFQANKNRISKQSSETELKTIVNDKTVSLLEAEKSAKSDEDDVNQKRRCKGINIKFNDIIYRARRNLSWDCCKCNEIKLLVRNCEWVSMNNCLQCHKACKSEEYSCWNYTNPSAFINLVFDTNILVKVRDKFKLQFLRV